MSGDEAGTGQHAGPGGINEALLREVLAYIELHPESWDQRIWGRVHACGTVACLAGWTYVLTSNDWGLQRWGQLNWDRSPSVFEVSGVAAYARDKLGLTDAQAWGLFHFGTDVRASPPTFAELCEVVEQVTGVRFKPAPEVSGVDG